jgi:hypothetical protein
MRVLGGVKGRENGGSVRTDGDAGDDGDDSLTFPTSPDVLSRLRVSHLPPPPSTSTFSCSTVTGNAACTFVMIFDSSGEWSRGAKDGNEV